MNFTCPSTALGLGSGERAGRLPAGPGKNRWAAGGAQERVEEVDADKAAFAAHRLVLLDPALVGKWRIRNGVNGARPFLRWSGTGEMLAQLEDEPTGRAADVEDVGKRILGNFLGVPHTNLGDIREAVVVLAPDLTPSKTAQLEPGQVLAFATAAGGRTSHAAIMARSLGIPAVVGLGEGHGVNLAQAQEAIVDGTRARWFVRGRRTGNVCGKGKGIPGTAASLNSLRNTCPNPDGRRARLLAQWLPRRPGAAGG